MRLLVNYYAVLPIHGVCRMTRTRIDIVLINLQDFQEDPALCGSMLPFAIKHCGLDPETSSAPFAATLVDVTGLGICFTVASVALHGTLLWTPMTEASHSASFSKFVRRSLVSRLVPELDDLQNGCCDRFPIEAQSRRSNQIERMPRVIRFPAATNLHLLA